MAVPQGSPLRRAGGGTAGYSRETGNARGAPRWPRPLSSTVEPQIPLCVRGRSGHVRSTRNCAGRSVEGFFGESRNTAEEIQEFLHPGATDGAPVPTAPTAPTVETGRRSRPLPHRARGVTGRPDDLVRRRMALLRSSARGTYEHRSRPRTAFPRPAGARDRRGARDQPDARHQQAPETNDAPKPRRPTPPVVTENDDQPDSRTRPPQQQPVESGSPSAPGRAEGGTAGSGTASAGK